MSVHWVLPVGPSVIGPGIELEVSADAATPWPSDAQWEFDFWQDAARSNNFMHIVAPGATIQTTTIIPYVQHIATTTMSPGTIIQNDATVYMTVTVFSQTSGVIDTGTFQGQWDNQTGVPFQILNQPTGVGQGLTPAQAQQLTTTETNTNTMDTNWSQYTSVTLPSLSSQLQTIQNGITSTIKSGATTITHMIGEFFSLNKFDTWAEDNLTGGPTCDPVRQDLSLEPVNGVAVRVTTIPPWMQPTTPDGNYYAQDLAVLTFLRAGEIIRRVPIHQPQVEVQPMPSQLTPLYWLDFAAPMLPPQYEVWVDWGMGCCGELVSFHLP